MPTGTRLNIYFTDEDDLALYDLISVEAKTEKRSMSQMVKVLASEALTIRRTKETLTQRPISTKKSSLNVEEPDAGTLLKLLAGGERPGDGELLEVAQKTGIREEELLELRDRLFPDGNQQKKRKYTK